jgi:hypothetical protein
MWALGATGLGLAVVAALLGGRTWKSMVVLAIVGIAAWGGWSVITVAAGDCSGATECTPELGAFLGAFLLVGWLAGLTLVATARTVLFSGRRSSRPLLGTRPRAREDTKNVGGMGP